MKNKKRYLSVFLIFTFYISLGQQLTPPIHNFTSLEYDGASQNWGIAVDNNGIIYAANNEGLLVFDGQRWELFPLKNRAVIRSVLPHNDRIYIGSYREFGYWSKDTTGELSYTSLMPLLKKGSVKSEEFWEILHFKDAIYFRSFGAIYKYENGSIETIRNVVSNKMVVYQNQLLISVGKRGIFFLKEDGTLDPLPNQEILSGKRVLDMEVDGNELLIGTRDHLFRYNGKECLPFEDENLNNQLLKFEFNHIMKLGPEQLLLATVRNGLIHYNIKSRQLEIYNRDNGLQNNTVLGMASDDGKVWLGLDNGIDVIDFDFPIQFYTDHTGKLGAVYDLNSFNGELYAASNTGVYILKNEGPLMINGAQGHSWGLETVEGKLISNHNSGTFKVTANNFKPLDNRTGSFTSVAIPDKNDFLIGTYTGISLYSPDSDSLKNLSGIEFPVKKILFEDSVTPWVEHANAGVFRIKLDQSFSRVLSKESIGDPANEDRVELFHINDQIAILKNQEWYRYNNFKESLEIFPELKHLHNHVFLLEDENGYWFLNREDHSLLFINFKDQKLDIRFEDLNKRNVKGNEKLIKAGDSLYYLTLKDGFASIDLHGMLKYRKKQKLDKPIFRALIDQRENRYDLKTINSLPYEDSRTITVWAGFPDSGSADLYYRLTGEEKFGGKIENGKVTFQNLPQGEYRLELFALNHQELTSDINVMEFSIESPWYLSLPLKLLYIVMGGLILGLAYIFNKRKLKKHRKVLEKKLEKDHQERLARLEKKRLEDEIMMKRKELANTTMMAAKKNEVLMDIQAELNKDKDKFSNQYRLKYIMTKINQAIKNKDEWQVFETNFKEVHEDFSKDLLVEHPNLTGKDLKLCSYLRMNLTSKEIAPLMGKSVRGVEVHRYRLRKKMNLKSQENLSSYLIKNF